MKTDHPPSGLLRGLDLLIDADWTPEQARAVIELLDDLRERIWAHYELALFEHYRQDRLTQADIRCQGLVSEKEILKGAEMRLQSEIDSMYRNQQSRDQLLISLQSIQVSS